MGILFFIISLLASAAGAVSGIGGGILMRPVIDATGLLSVSAASFLSGCTVLIMTSVSLFRDRKSSVKIDRLHTLPLAIGSVLGGIVGKIAFDGFEHLLSERLLGAGQAVMLLLLTVGVFCYIVNKKKIHPHQMKKSIWCLVLGLVLGCISSFLGIGGGPLNLAVLFFFFSMETKTAVKNSLYMIWFAQAASFVQTILFSHIPEFPQILLIFMGAGGVLGALIGTALLKHLTSDQVERIFLGIMIVIIGINCYNVVRYLC